MVDLNMNKHEGNGWDKYQLLVLNELERLNNQVDAIAGKLDDTRLEFTRQIATLQVKAGVWGMIGASIPTAIAIIFMLTRGTS